MSSLPPRNWNRLLVSSCLVFRCFRGTSFASTIAVGLVLVESMPKELAVPPQLIAPSTQFPQPRIDIGRFIPPPTTEEYLPARASGWDTQFQWSGNLLGRGAQGEVLLACRLQPELPPEVVVLKRMFTVRPSLLFHVAIIVASCTVSCGRGTSVHSEVEGGRLFLAATWLIPHMCPP